MKIIKIAVYKPVSGVTGRVNEPNRLVQSLGAQLMAMKPEKRRCLECLGSLAYDTGCGGRKIPSCESCNGSFSRGEDGYYIIMTDEDGVVIGTMDPVVIDGKAYLPPVKEFELMKKTKTKTKTKNTKKQVGCILEIFDKKRHKKTPVPIPVFRGGKLVLEGNDF